MAHKQCFRREIAFCQTENVRLGVFFILVIDQLLCNPPHPFATKKELSCDLFRSWSQTIGAKRTIYGVAISIYFAAAFFTLCKVIIMSVLQFFIGKSRAWFEHTRNGLHIWLTGQTCQLCPRLTECIILKYFGRAVRCTVWAERSWSPNSTVLHLEIYLLCKCTNLKDTAGHSVRPDANISALLYSLGRAEAALWRQGNGKW